MIKNHWLGQWVIAIFEVFVSLIFIEIQKSRDNDNGRADIVGYRDHFCTNINRAWFSWLFNIKIVEFQLEELRTFIDISDVTSESVGPWLKEFRINHIKFTSLDPTTEPFTRTYETTTINFTTRFHETATAPQVSILPQTTGFKSVIKWDFLWQ